MARDSVTGGGVLGTARQRAAEQQALRIFGSAPVAAAMARTAALYRSTSNAQLPDQDALIQRSVREQYFHAALMAAGEDPAEAGFIWSIAPEHAWLGLKVPGSRFGQDNPDTCYRFASVDPARRYRISGRFAAPPLCDFSICALPGQVGDGFISDVLAILKREDLDIDAAGRFTASIDASPTAGRRNHLCIAGARTLQVRDTLADWNAERPTWLELSTSDAPAAAAAPAWSLEAACARAAQLGHTIAALFLERVQRAMFECQPLNTISAPCASGGRGGLVTQMAALGWYRLADDEALVIDADRLGARYVGIQVVDLWLVSHEYRHRSSSLNHCQAVPDADGRYRWVIARRDPGVHNWLDCEGHASGDVLLRWQHVPEGAATAGAVRADLVKIDALRRRLPPGTRYVTAAERAALHEHRRRGYLVRLE